MNFGDPIDEVSIPGRGVVQIVKLPHGSSKTAVNALIGTTVNIGDRQFAVRGVETYAVMHFNAGTPIGLLGDWRS